MSEQRHTFTADTQVAVHGYSDDTFGVYWGSVDAAPAIATGRNPNGGNRRCHKRA